MLAAPNSTVHLKVLKRYLSITFENMYERVCVLACFANKYCYFSFCLIKLCLIIVINKIIFKDMRNLSKML